MNVVQMLTVLKKSHQTIKFYKKLGFSIDPTSPSQFEEKAFYEIFSKVTSSKKSKKRRREEASRVPSDTI
jgi:hypothetical protein